MHTARLRTRLTPADRIAVALLAVLPVVMNLGFALAGRPVLDGDNLTQNYPLRVLTGRLIAHGELPLWDPGIWSGVPLLAGWNAGAMFPGTWLFAVLGGVPAFEIDLVGTGVVCGIAAFAFFRRSGGSPLASVLGALVWSDTGFVSGQAVHLGLIEGTALAPVMLLAIDGIFRARDAGARSLLWSGLLGLAAGLVVLAGDPRAVTNDAIIAAVYFGARCWRDRRHLVAVAGDVLAAAVLAVGVGAVQWLPGLTYLHSSQRSASTLSLFGYYSLGWGDLPLLVVPYLIGGNGNFGQPVYAGPLNMPEVTYAVGLLPLVALFALAPTALRRVGRQEGRPALPPIGVWYVMFAVGLVLATGTSTPLGHLLVHVPLYGGERDQNRNSAMSDFALAALLVVFLDHWRDILPSRARLRRALGCIPLLGAAGLIVTILAWPTGFQGALGVLKPDRDLPARMGGYYAFVLVTAIAAAVVLLRRRWRSPENWRRMAAVVVGVEVAGFLVLSSYQPVPTSVLAAQNGPLAALMAQLPEGERIAIDDPDQLALDNPQFLADRLGVDDLALLHAVASVQGYGSAVPAGYAAATGTHDVENLLPSALAGDTFDYLDLGLVVVVPEQFGRILPRGSSAPVPPGPPVPLGESAADTQPGGVARAAYPPSGPWRLGAPGLSWQMPSPVRMSAVKVGFEGAVVGTGLTVVCHEPDGATFSLPLVVTGESALATVPEVLRTREVISLSIARGSGSVVSSVVPSLAVAGADLALQQPAGGTVRFALDGWLQGLLDPPHWRYAGRIGPLVVYRDTRARGEAWLEAPSSTSPAAPGVAGSVSTPATQPWQDPLSDVEAPAPCLLVRSEEWAPGWSASVESLGAGGNATSTRNEAVRQVGLVQGVEVPAGRSVVVWHYGSSRAELGLALTVGSTAACTLLVAAGCLERRRRLRRAVPGPAPDTPDPSH